jgi:hypothetical protein
MSLEKGIEALHDSVARVETQKDQLTDVQAQIIQLLGELVRVVDTVVDRVQKLEEREDAPKRARCTAEPAEASGALDEPAHQ